MTYKCKRYERCHGGVRGYNKHKWGDTFRADSRLKSEFGQAVCTVAWREWYSWESFP